MSKEEYLSAVIDKPRSVQFVKKPLSKPKSGELLIKMEGVGLCASNIPVWEGREWFNYPMEEGTPGHEGWGFVEEAGEGTAGFAKGDRVALLQGNVFSEFVCASAENCVKLPENIAGVPFPGEPFGCMMNILRRSDIQENQNVAVIGVGFLGLGLVKLAKQKGAKVFAFSRRDSALKAAKKYADHVIKMDDHQRILQEMEKLTEGKGCERVIECTGKQWPLDLAGELINNYGKLIIAGYHQDGSRSVNMQQWNWKAIDVINAHERDQEKYKEGIKAAIKATENGLLNPKEMLSHSYRFNDLEQAFDDLSNCPEGFIKGYVDFNKTA